ncbi:phytoene/squalene synthase family protein [Parvularcula dongshanensis]|uniref:Phytoene synthase n=1 Tax=Parvularcula dongshanensis TaxID=1173995 RepID=A0A840I772_9PROT|nr:phytoene/squalene synthase family protein [Parvularcula dongshanensis]MBB4660111.1 phytoene synthase [Parvularcula dongshanensis]
MKEVEAAASEAIAKGSRSFALASLLFRPTMRRHAHMLYAWCRHCDDVIDGQNLGFGEDSKAGAAHTPRRSDLDALRSETLAALRGGEVSSAPMAAFREVALATDMPAHHPLDLLRGFEMDVEARDYRTISDTLEYCYHVAGVVGVMMAIVMGVDPDDQETLDRAADLGIAFQLTNIARDVVDDAAIGRVYLPSDWLAEHGIDGPEGVLDPANRDGVSDVARRLLAVAERYYESAGPGVRRLPIRAGFAVAAARGVYRDIGRVVRQRGPAAWDVRARTSKKRKLALAGLGCMQGASAKVMVFRALPPRGDLWKYRTEGTA